jgi:hypothetical protein
MSKNKSSNRAKAPQCAAFVDAMREAFGDVKVLYVNEGNFTLGEPSDKDQVLAAATAFDGERKTLLEKKAA